MLLFGASQGVAYSCGVGANYWIERYFGDCVYSALDTAGFCIGLSSVFFWLIAQLPQFISNFLRSAADALSPWFLAQWLAGDTFNFLGCVLTGDQLKTQTITAGYFIFSDIVIITQYLYYQARNKNAIDFDESTHKGSGYADVVKSNDNRESALEKHIDESPHTRAFTDFQVRRLIHGIRPNSGSSHDRSVTDSTSGATIGNHGALSALSDSKQQESWTYEHRHRLRRLVQEYGLEYGHATAMRLTSIHKNKHKEKYNSRSQLKSSQRALESASFSRRSRYKAVLGIAGLFGLISLINLQGFSSVHEGNNADLGFAIGRRVLLALHDAGATTVKKPTLMDVGQPGAAFIAGQLLAGAYSWSMTIGRLLGWASSGLYLGSRVSQIVKNKQRRSADGLSLGMVTCAVLANVTYGTSIIMRGPSWDYLVGKAPWLVGSLGTVFLDFSLFIQAHYYSWYSKKGVPNEYTPLLA